MANYTASIDDLIVALDSLRMEPSPLRVSAGSKCLTNLCILDEIIVHIDGASILRLAVTCKWVWNLLKRSQVPWRRALANHEDFAMSFPGAHLRTARTLVILHFSSECVMCGIQTMNPIIGNHAVRLCHGCSAQYLVAMPTHTIWERGPHLAVEQVFMPDIHKTPPTSNAALLYPAELVQTVPINFNNYVTPPPDRRIASDEATGSPTEFFSGSHMNPTYSDPSDIDRGCGFPTDWDDEDFQGMQTPSASLTDSHGPFGSPAGALGLLQFPKPMSIAPLWRGKTVVGR